jgi:TetR/AcrR family transcriptional regulator
MPRPPARRRRDIPADVLRAAGVEFAAHGLRGARVDRLARRARANKALIYYYFGSKLALYRRVVRDGFAALVGAAVAAVHETDAPASQLDRYVASLLATTTARPQLLPTLLHEIADGGRNLDPETLQQMFALFGVVHGILTRGRARGVFEDVDPLLTHFMIMGSTMLYVANEPIRTRVRRLGLPDSPRLVPIGAEPFLRHMSLVLRRTLHVRADEAVHV